MATLTELLAKASVVKYLEAKGTQFIRSGRRMKCRCPLPKHPNDNTPSFYVTVAHDGVELFNCFGCNQGGNYITLVRLMEGKPNKQVVRELAQSMGATLDRGQVPTSDPVGSDLMQLFVDEDLFSMQIADYMYSFLEAHQGSDEAITKANLFYRRLDDLSSRGDGKGMRELFETFRKANFSFKGAKRR